MKEDNVVKDKSLAFGVRIVKLCRYLLGNISYAEHAICSQLLKAGTSIGANIREAEHAESKIDFIHKMKIALKEANETAFWLEIFFQAEYLNESEYKSIMNDCEELNKLLISIVNTSKRNHNDIINNDDDTEM